MNRWELSLRICIDNRAYIFPANRLEPVNLSFFNHPAKKKSLLIYFQYKQVSS